MPGCSVKGGPCTATNKVGTVYADSYDGELCNNMNCNSLDNTTCDYAAYWNNDVSAVATDYGRDLFLPVTINTNGYFQTGQDMCVTDDD